MQLLPRSTPTLSLGWTTQPPRHPVQFLKGVSPGYAVRFQVVSVLETVDRILRLGPEYLVWRFGGFGR